MKVDAYVHQLGGHARLTPFVVGRTYKAIVYGDEAMVVKRTDCTVTLRGAYDGRLPVRYYGDPKTGEACEFVTTKKEGKGGRPRVLAFYSSETADQTSSQDKE